MAYRSREKAEYREARPRVMYRLTLENTWRGSWVMEDFGLFPSISRAYAAAERYTTDMPKLPTPWCYSVHPEEV
jgi:hypothetical protein